MSAGAPIDAAEAGRLFAPLAPFRNLGIAVSGGADSVALMWLLARWQRELPDRPRLVVLTVDHRLRPESAAEARAVAGWSTGLGLEHRTLCREGAPITANIQANARAARYRLLAEAGTREGLDAVLTAHHLDDQAETLLLRLARGSGLYGLGAMSPGTTIDGLHVLRPLIDVPRDRLVATLAAAGHPFLDDPSNGNERYARVRLRRMMPALAGEGMTARRLADTASRLRRAAAALDSVAENLLRSAGTFHPGGFAVLDPGALVPAPEEIGLRALSRLVREVAMAPFPPRLDRLEKVYRAIADDIGSPLRRTLGGAVVSLEKERLLVYPEAGRPGFPETTLEPGENLIWDGRFRVFLAPDAPAVDIGPLGPDGWRTLPPPLQKTLPRRAAMTTLAARRNGELIAVPAFAWPAAGSKTGICATHLGPLFAKSNPVVSERDATRP